MRDLEDVDVGQAATHERGVEIFLEVAQQEEPTRAGLPEQHDRRVVDRLAVRQEPVRDSAAIRPEHAEGELVERQPIAGSQHVMGWTPGREERRPGVVAGAIAW
jgi:hypothetical protein